MGDHAAQTSRRIRTATESEDEYMVSGLVVQREKPVAVDDRVVESEPEGAREDSLDPTAR